MCAVYCRDGISFLGFDKAGYNKDGFDKDGYDKDGYDRYGYDKAGYDKQDRDVNVSMYMPQRLCSGTTGLTLGTSEAAMALK